MHGDSAVWRKGHTQLCTPTSPSVPSGRDRSIDEKLLRVVDGYFFFPFLFFFFYCCVFILPTEYNGKVTVSPRTSRPVQEKNEGPVPGPWFKDIAHSHKHKTSPFCRRHPAPKVGGQTALETEMVEIGEASTEGRDTASPSIYELGILRRRRIARGPVG